jgi:hypothetical protein
MKNISLLLIINIMFLDSIIAAESDSTIEKKGSKKIIEKKEKKSETISARESKKSNLDKNTTENETNSSKKIDSKYGNRDEKKKILENIEWQVRLFSDGNFFNNADLRELDESSDSAIDNTDDKISFAVTGFELSFFLPLTYYLECNISLYKIGVWGNDQLGYADDRSTEPGNPSGTHPLSFNKELNIETYFLRSRNTELSLAIGRQPFEIGGIERDYIFKDILDAVVLKYNYKYLGIFDVLLFDWYWQGANVTDVNYVNYIKENEDQTDNFDGDVNTIRYGFIYTSGNLINWGDDIRDNDRSSQLWSKIKLYSFINDYGASLNGTTDRTKGGISGNFADNDFVNIFGSRFLFNFQIIHFYGDFTRSLGIDRKAKGYANKNNDVDTDGNAFGTGVEIRPMNLDSLKKNLNISKNSFSMVIKLNYFQADGLRYGKDGKLKSHGFTGFKGDHTGGLLMNQYYGFHPCAYTGNDSIDNFPHNQDRKSGTRVIRGGMEVTFLTEYTIGGDIWHYQDMGQSSSTEFKHIRNYSQKRLGKILGTEFDLFFQYMFNKYLTFHLTGAVFYPGNFYETPGLNLSDPYGKEKMYGIQGGFELIF